MPQLTTAGRLLNTLHRDTPVLSDMIAAAAGITAEGAASAMTGGARLTLAEQLRLAEATRLFAPKYARDAARLRAQALAARSYENAESVEVHRDAPVERWERSAQLRR